MVLHSEEVVLAVQDTCPLAGGHHSKILRGAEHLREQAADIIINKAPLDTPYHHHLAAVTWRLLRNCYHKT